MSPRSADPESAARVAVIGAVTVDGGRVRAALAAAGVPGQRVDLFGETRGTDGEVVLGEYAGEARMIPAPDPAEILGYDVIFLCEPGEISRRIAASPVEGQLVIDLCDCLPQALRARRVHLDLMPEIAGAEAGGCYAMSHPLTLLLTDVLHPLDREIGLAGATAVVIRPAADFGEPALAELREQTVRLLGFADLPLETFGTQLAFNVIPQSRLDRLEPGVEARVVRESAEILDRDPPALALRMVTAPIFHGHAFQLHVRPATAVPIERASGVLEAAGLLDPQAAPTTPLEVESYLRLSPLEEDGAGGFWLWGAAADISKRAAEQAVRLAARLRTLQLR